jgi:peptidoglycan/xylan/chitin deacetylase (PgdA/CDA1 family)
MFFSNWFAKRKIAILLFHSVVAGTPPKGTRRFGPETSISSDEFEQIIRKASEKYNILSMDDVWQGKTSDKPGIVLTFDDGFQDNIDIALPILKKFNAPAMIYVTSGFIDRSVNPFEYLLSDVIEKNTEIAIQYSKFER